MPLLLETIKIENGLISNLHYHQERCNRSRQTFYPHRDTLTLNDTIQAPPKGLYRCRILYDKSIRSIEYIPYQPKQIKHIQIVSSDIDYSHKYADRTTLNGLVEQYHKSDDILIEKDGCITDTSIANIAFYTEGQWYTPSKPLLKGTQRQKLLDENFLQTKEIKVEDLHHYTQVALMNAMIGFNVLKNIHIQDLEGNIYDY